MPPWPGMDTGPATPGERGGRAGHTAARKQVDSALSLELRGPVVATLEVTPQGDTRGGQLVCEAEGPVLTAAQVTCVVERLVPFVSEFRIKGAEPALRADLLDILGVLDRVERPYHLFTSGAWPDRQGFLVGLKALAWLQSIVVSLHGHDATTHAACNGTGTDFEQVVKTLEVACSTGIEVSTSTTITRANAEHLEEVVELAVRLGVRHTIFNRCVDGRSGEGEVPPQVLRTCLAKLDELRQLGYNISLGSCVPACFFRDFAQGCSGGITYCVVDPWGRVRPCDHSPTLMGSLLEQGVTDLWRSRPMKAWRNNLPRVCRKCSSLNFCPGGCRSLAENLGIAADPLIGDALPPEEPTVLDVTLEEDLCPVPRYEVRDEDFGWALVRQAQVIPVSQKAGPVLSCFDGRTTLGEIEKKHGAAALSFIYSLYARSFVEFQPREAAPAG